MSHLSRVAGLRWTYGAADEFFSRQLPHNITWLLTLVSGHDSLGPLPAVRPHLTSVHLNDVT